MARISKDQLRQFIMDGKLSRSPSPKKKPSSSSQVAPQQPIVEAKQAVPSASRAMTTSKPKKQKMSKSNYLRRYLEARRGKKPSSSSEQNQQDQVNEDQVVKPTVPEKSGFPTYDQIQNQANQFNQDVIKDRQEYAKYADEFLNQPMQGLTPQERASYQESADVNLNRDVQNYRRMIDSDMGARGIQGGAAQIPKTELARAALESQQQFQRDLTTMDADKAREKLAAKLALQEGMVGQGILNRQQAFDYLSAKNASEEEKDYLDRFHKQYFGDAEKKNALMDKLIAAGFKPKKKKSNKVGSR